MGRVSPQLELELANLLNATEVPIYGVYIAISHRQLKYGAQVLLLCVWGIGGGSVATVLGL